MDQGEDGACRLVAASQPANLGARAAAGTSRSGPSRGRRRVKTHHRATRVFAPEASSVPAARSWSGEHLATWGVADRDDSLLIISELVTNAIAHGDGPVRVRLQFDPATVRVEVSDAGRGVVRPAHPGPHDTSGRGLMLVDRFAEAWGVDRHDGTGKTVWAELAVRGA